MAYFITSLYLLEELPTPSIPSCASVFSIVFLSLCNWICSSFICALVFPKFPSSVHQPSLCEEGERTTPQCSLGPWSNMLLIQWEQKLSGGIAWPDSWFWGLNLTVLHECDECGEDRNGGNKEEYGIAGLTRWWMVEMTGYLEDKGSWTSELAMG